MAWVRVDDHFNEHPKHAKAGPLSCCLWLAGLAYCNRNLTDGFIPWSVAQTLVSWEYLSPPDDEGRHKRVTVSVTCGMSGGDIIADDVIAQLVWSGLWEEVDGGYQVHDYDDYQPSKKYVLRSRKQASSRKRMSRERHAVTPKIGHANVTHDVTVSSQPSQSQSQSPKIYKRTLSASADRSLLNGFEALWKNYPEPKGPKAPALKAYKEKKPPAAEALEALKAQIAHKAACDRRDQFWPQLPHLVRWLKQERWTDAIPDVPHQDDPLDREIQRIRRDIHGDKETD